MPTQRLSNLIDILLKPLCTEVKSYVRDDLDFLRHLPDTITPSDKLVTMDVTNLYTNITCTLGLKALEYWINKHPEKNKCPLQKRVHIRSVRNYIKEQCFQF